jgi:hypothetical protein
MCLIVPSVILEALFVWTNHGFVVSIAVLQTILLHLLICFVVVIWDQEVVEDGETAWGKDVNKLGITNWREKRQNRM